jgi:hypothetical protein
MCFVFVGSQAFTVTSFLATRHTSSAFISFLSTLFGCAS